MEKILSDQLYGELERCHVLASNQFGFWQGLSCEYAAQRLISSVTEARERGLYSAAIFFDIGKAFDSVSHKRLLLKVDRQGIGGTALRLLVSYLRDRTQVFQQKRQWRIQVSPEGGRLHIFLVSTPF